MRNIDYHTAITLNGFICKVNSVIFDSGKNIKNGNIYKSSLLPRSGKYHEDSRA